METGGANTGEPAESPTDAPGCTQVIAVAAGEDDLALVGDGTAAAMASPDLQWCHPRNETEPIDLPSWGATGNHLSATAGTRSLKEDIDDDGVDVLQVEFLHNLLQTLQCQSLPEAVAFLRQREPRQFRDLHDSAIERLLQEHAPSILPNPGTPISTAVHIERGKIKNRRSGLKYNTKQNPKKKQKVPDPDGRAKASSNDEVHTGQVPPKRRKDDSCDSRATSDGQGGGVDPSHRASVVQRRLKQDLGVPK